MATSAGKAGGHQGEAAERTGAVRGDDADFRPDEIARAGYEAIAADDQRAAGEALRLFITDTLAARSARVAALGRATPFQ